MAEKILEGSMNTQELIERYAAHREGGLELSENEEFSLEVELAQVQAELERPRRPWWRLSK